jgi:hypothetical protein
VQEYVCSNSQESQVLPQQPFPINQHGIIFEIADFFHNRPYGLDSVPDKEDLKK